MNNSVVANTLEQYDEVINNCRKVFINKTRDYGTSWRILRQQSITDQIYIKAQRIRTIEEKGLSKINEGREDEFVGIINYCIIALIQLNLKEPDKIDLNEEEVETLFNKEAETTRNLMLDKNHDYGEAWRSMRVSSFTDLILMRLMRIKQIEDNSGKTIASEGVESNFRDMINYAIFALIKIGETNETDR